mgnify:CR=1 FL=1
MISLHIPQPLLCYINKVRGRLSTALYIIKCIDYIKTNDIDIYSYYYGDHQNNVITKGTKERGEVLGTDKLSR